MSAIKRGSPGADEKKNPLEPVPLSEEDATKLQTVQKNIARIELKIQRIAELRLVPAYDARREVTKTIPKFWAIALMNHTMFAISCQHSADQLALSYLEDVKVDRDPKEPRCFALEFHFKENPYFSDAVLKKEYKYNAPKPEDGDKPDEDGVTDAMLDFSWERDVEASTVQINWKDPAKALTKLYPREAADDDDDMPTETGSFFNFFERTDDPLELGNVIANEIYPEAIDYFLGNIGGDGELDSDDDESDDDDADEIDLEKPKLKKQKV
jgi:template-activating factor I